jgi:hypothetical protein
MLKEVQWKQKGRWEASIKIDLRKQVSKDGWLME